MRCLSCNKILNDYESTRRSSKTKEFIDLCSSCFSTFDDSFQIVDRNDLKHVSDEVYYSNEEVDFNKWIFTKDLKKELENG